MQISTKKSQNIVIGIFIGLVIFALGILTDARLHVLQAVTPNISNADSANTTPADFAPFWKVWNLIDAKHPNAANVDDQTRIWGAIKGLVATLDDPYSVFLDPTETESFDAAISGEISGIGIEIGIKNGVLTVIAPLKDSPAEKAGLRPGDTIFKIDGKESSTLTVDEAIDLIRGKAGTVVNLTIFSEGNTNPKDVKIVRADITIPTLDTKELGNGIFMISFYNFGANADREFKAAIKEFDASTSSKLILDLRGNPGGYLDASVQIASWFIPKGRTIIVEKTTDAAKETMYKSLGYTLNKKNFPFVILVDEGSASASEILAGALQEYKIATLVGTTTYGKGSVQEVIPVTNDTELKITVAKWYTPNGVSISEQGLTPDMVVSISDADIEASKDPQLDAAKELLAK